MASFGGGAVCPYEILCRLLTVQIGGSAIEPLTLVIKGQECVGQECVGPTQQLKDLLKRSTAQFQFRFISSFCNRQRLCLHRTRHREAFTNAFVCISDAGIDQWSIPTL